MTASSPTYGRLELRGDRWVLSDVPPHVAIRLKSVFQRIPKTKTGVFDLPASDEMSADLRWFMERYPLAMTEDHRARLEEGRRLFELDRAESEAILLPDWQPSPVYGFKPGFGLYHPQAQARELVLRNKRLLLGDTMGLGKTWTALGTLIGSKYLPAAVVVKTHLADQWVNEFIKPFTYLSAHIIRGTQPYSLPPANIYLFKYSNLAGWSDFLATGFFKAAIFDEGHELRNGARTEKGKAAKILADNAGIRLLMTGTPIFNYGSEIWNIMQFVDADILGHWEEFVVEWCEMGPGDKWLVKDPQALGTYLRSSQVFLRRLREGRPINKLVVDVDYDQEVAESAEDLAVKLAIKATTASFTERGQAARELDALARQVTGVAKAKSVAAYVRMLLSAGRPVILFGWHRECFAKDTMVLMADGTTKPVQAVQIGDLVMGPDSSPREVLSTVSGNGPMYRVVPNKGDPWVCSRNHILTLVPEGSDRSPVKMTAEAFAALPERKRRSLCLYRADIVNFPERNAAVEPWLLGYWLGDGASSLRDLRVSSADMEVAAEMRMIAARYGLRLVRWECKRGATPCCFWALFAQEKRGPNQLRDHFRSMGLDHNKHIPLSYKTASVEDRRQLLAGLIDSDGHVYHGNGAGSACFTNNNEQLAREVLFVARSLGLAATIKKAFKQERRGAYAGGAPYSWLVTISGDLTAIPMRIARKKAPQRRQIKNVLHTGFDVHSAEVSDFYGFEVSGDNLFLLEDFTVVHNCYDIWQRELADFHPVMFTGTETPRQKEKSKAAFLGGDTNLCLMSLRSGEGTDGLQKRCSTVVFGELDWSPAVHAQGVGRVDRPGQEADVIDVIYLVTNEGSDPVVMRVNAIKSDQQTGVVDPGLAAVELKPDLSRLQALAKHYLEKRAA